MRLIQSRIVCKDIIAVLDAAVFRLHRLKSDEAAMLILFANYYCVAV
jgi:hypothetical protein